jgi:tetratricopeptide (TPR) repeat protein
MDEAVGVCDAALAAVPSDANLQAVLGGLLTIAGPAQEAEASFRRALEIDPSNRFALNGLGVVLLRAGRYPGALEQAEKLIELNPNDRWGYRVAGLALDRLGRDEEAALRYRKALELDANDGLVWGRLVWTLAASGQAGAAMQAAEDGLQAAPTDPAWIYYARGEINRAASRFDLALADYEQAIRLDPSLLIPRFGAITTLIAMGRPEEAISRLAGALEVHKQKPEPRILADGLPHALVALFRYAAENALPSQLSQMAELLQGAGLLTGFDQALSLALFSALRNHALIEESRFRVIESAVRDALSPRLDTTVLLRLLDTGIRYFKQNDRKALLSLAREERELFVKELGIAGPAD